jgi:hypothetical protein
MSEFTLTDCVKVFGGDLPFFNNHPIFDMKTGASLFTTGPAADAFRDCCSGLEGSRMITFFMFFIFKIHLLFSVF